MILREDPGAAQGAFSPKQPFRIRSDDVTILQNYSEKLHDQHKFDFSLCQVPYSECLEYEEI